MACWRSLSCQPEGKPSLTRNFFSSAVYTFWIFLTASLPFVIMDFGRFGRISMDFSRVQSPPAANGRFLMGKAYSAPNLPSPPPWAPQISLSWSAYDLAALSMR